jgi:DNA-binding transcriptional ArsR family regulator
MSGSSNIIITKDAEGNEISVDLMQVKKVNMIIRAMNHKLRQQILKLLEQSGPLTVTDVQQKLHLEQSVTSQHLGILRRTNLVKTEKEGKAVYYSLNNERIASLWNSILALLT